MAHDIEIRAEDLNTSIFSHLSKKERQEAIDKAKGILRVEVMAWEQYFEKLEIQAMMSENRENLEVEIAQLKWHMKRLCKRTALHAAASEMCKEKIYKKEKKQYNDSAIDHWM
ncbi:MAG: hypothetical protein ABIN18_17385 [Pseudomonadota bacterium]